MISVPVAAWMLARNRRRRIAATLSVTAAPVTTGTVNIAYAGFTVSADGGQGDEYRFSLASGSLPPGIALSPFTGAVEGTPTVAGAYAASIRVADAAGNHRDTAPFTITVSA